MCNLQPESEILADFPPQPIVFRSATCDQPQYRLTCYNNAHSQPEEWNPEQESQESDNDGELLSLTGFSPAVSNIHVEMENHELRKRVSCPLVGEIKCISDLENHHSDKELEYPTGSSPLQHRFVSYRPILTCDSSGWHAFAFSYFEIFLQSRSQFRVDEEISRILSFDNLLKTAGQYNIELIRDKINETTGLLKALSKLKTQSLESASDLLLCRLNDSDVSGAITCHFRLIASSWLAAKPTTYDAYIPKGFDINTYRTQWLDAPHQEIDALGMTLLVDALLRPLRVGFEVTSVRKNETATHCEYPKFSVVLDDNDPSTRTITIHLLYRPNHYDILYPENCASGTQGVASNSLPHVTLKVTRAEFDAHSFKESNQMKIPSVRDLTSFTPHKLNFLAHLSNLRLSESGVDSILGVGELSRVLNVRTAVNHKTFEPESAPLTGLDDIDAFAKVQAQKEATHAAQRSRLKETEPQAPSTSLSSIKKSMFLAGDSVLQSLGYAMQPMCSQLKHTETISQNTDPPKTVAADSKEIAKLSTEELLGSHIDSSTDYETDWEEEEEELDEEEARVFFRDGSRLTRNHMREGSSLKSILGQVRDELMTCLMKEFWDIAKQTVTPAMRMHGSSSDSSSPSSDNNGTLQTNSSSFTPGKRSREDGNGEPPEQDRGRDSKKPKSGIAPLEISDESIQFACPYRKHNPRKYNVNEWAACALTPKTGLNRVKYHLYRNHLIHQCPRCKDLFQTESELEMHFNALEGCDVRASNPDSSVEGITDRLHKQLRCRKKLYANQTEAERWQQVYQLLFPNEIVPSPYFEPVRDLKNDESPIPDSIRFEEHLRREVPRIFKTLLDTEVDNELQSIEERLKSRLLELLQEAQNQAVVTYHSSSQAAPGTLTAPQFVESQPASLAPSTTPVLSNNSEAHLETFYQTTLGEVEVDGQLGPSECVVGPNIPQHHSSFDSGCYTNSWETEYSQQNPLHVETDTSPVGESARPGGIDDSMQLQNSGTVDSMHDETWPYHPGSMTMDDPLDFQPFTTWNQQLR